jgi:NADH-quinone oxidoreductase subunit J
MYVLPSPLSPDLVVAAAAAAIANRGGTAPALVAPALLFVLAVAGAIGVILLLPARGREAPVRAIGAAVLIAVGIILAAVVARAGTGGGMGVYFWIFSAIAVIGAVRVITHTKPVYSALYFVLSVMATSGLFVLMWAEFMAAALVLIYAGAILVTYVFVIMLASEAAPESAGKPMHQHLVEYDQVSREPVAASAVGFALLGILLFVAFDRAPTLREDASGGGAVATAQAQTAAAYPGGVPSHPIAQADARYAVAQDVNPGTGSGFTPIGATQRLGNYLFNKQLVNLELAGLLLTVAMVGAIVIARRRVYGVRPLTAEEPTSNVIVGPSTPITDDPHSIPVYGTEDARQKEYPET